MKVLTYDEQVYVMWPYEDAVKLVNTGVKAFEYKERYDNLKLLNDSLLQKIIYIGLQRNLAQSSYIVCLENSNRKDEIIRNKDMMLVEYERDTRRLKRRNKSVLMIAVAVLGGILIIN